MLHCSHCLTHCEDHRYNGFVCCPGCGKVLGQYYGGKYFDPSKPLPILENTTKLKKRKNERNQKHKKKIEIDSADLRLAT